MTAVVVHRVWTVTVWRVTPRPEGRLERLGSSLSCWHADCQAASSASGRWWDKIQPGAVCSPCFSASVSLAFSPALKWRYCLCIQLKLTRVLKHCWIWFVLFHNKTFKLTVWNTHVHYIFLKSVIQLTPFMVHHSSAISNPPLTPSH